MRATLGPMTSPAYALTTETIRDHLLWERTGENAEQMSRAFGEWLSEHDRELRAEIAARDAVIEKTISALKTLPAGGWIGKVMAAERALSAAPESVLRARDAEKWDEGAMAELLTEYSVEEAAPWLASIQHHNPYREGPGR